MSQDVGRVPEHVRSVVERTRALVREVVLPLDDAHDGDVEAAGGARVGYLRPWLDGNFNGYFF